MNFVEIGPGVHHRRVPRALWLVPVLIVVLLSFVVPFVVLRGVDAWYGSMLFWILDPGSWEQGSSSR